MKEKGHKRNQIRVGLDIGTRLIKVLEVSLENGTYKLVKFHSAKIDFPTSGENVAEALTTLLETFQPSTKEVNISLSAPSAIVRFITMPKMKEEDLRNALRFEAEKYIPFNINEVVIDAAILKGPTEEKNQMRVLLAAAKKEAMEKRIDLLKKVGLTASLVDIDSFACFNAFCNAMGNLDDSKSAALLNIGHAQTNVIISRADEPFFVRDIPVGGSAVAAAVSNALQVAEKDSENLIIDPKDKASEILEIAKSVLNSLVDELRLSFGYYENQYGRSINEVYISGGVARLNGITEYIEDNFGIKPVLWNPFSKFELDPGIDGQLAERVRSQFGVSAGLAIRK